MGDLADKAEELKDSQRNLVLGRTRWWRFAAVVVPATIAMIAMMGGIASGLAPVALNVSGQTAMLSADKLDATGFTLFPGFVQKKDGTRIPVAASQIRSADLTNLCQSVKVPIGGGRTVTLFIRAGREAGKPAHAERLLIAFDYQAGDATFTNIRIGTDASALTKGGPWPSDLPPPVGLEGQFGQEADRAVIEGLNQRFYSTFAGEFRLTGLTVNLKFDGSECFTTIKP
jgi:Family of unknown function (DUF6230)